jgi:glutathione synthase
MSKSGGKKTLWVTDPWSTLDYPKETTLRLMEEAIALSQPTYWASLDSIRLENGEARLTAQKLISVDPSRTGPAFHFAEAKAVAPSFFDRIHYRTDPPVDAHYLDPLALLAQATARTKTEIVNPAHLLATRNEKFWIGAPKNWFPATLVSAQVEPLMEFGSKLGFAVAKPLHGAQSKGVERLKFATPEEQAQSHMQLKALVQGGRSLIALQEFLPEIEQGEIRVWFVDGKALASVRKYPLSGDFRVQIDSGSKVEAVEIPKKIRSRVREVGVFLKKQGIRLAAVDWVGTKITDLNFTSPGLLVQMEQLTGRNLAAELLKKLK